MRRPSWNKSQAIQQATSNSVDSMKEPSDINNNAVSGSVDDTAPCRQNDSPKSTPGPLDCQPEEADNKAFASRSLDATDGSVGQMTIFYCGKVNVYDGIPPDKAQAIMHLAASRIQSPMDDPIRRPAFSFPCHFQTQSDKHGFIPPNAAISQANQTGRILIWKHLPFAL
ncbi:hypothetical protein GH714_003789 [Hevea brasiliensis]|uniref:Protein TIFY n=1 Tax=Hevea brasiliensis TaxID=3981 RepID=A0A6A6KQ32_HEVBR|nr:hypothetical protein GH714_003789 [Hevea brasiliensis]